MTTKTKEEDGAARVWEFLHRQLHLISDCNSHTHTHVCIYTTAQMCMSLSLSLSHSLTHSAWIFMYSRVKWHLKHVSSSIALAHVAGHDANEEHSRSLYKCAQCTFVHMHVSVCVCVCVASGISSCLATIWASLAGTVRAAEATHETCLLINTAMNHCTFPARGVSWQNAFVSLHLHTCVYVYMYLCGYMYCTHVYVVHYSVLCSLLLLLFFGFLLRFLWFVCDFHASFRLVCVRSLLGYASNMHTDTHTRIQQSYVLISCPFTSLSISLSLSFAQFAWCELWLRFGTCPSLHAHLFFLLLLFVSLF